MTAQEIYDLTLVYGGVTVDLQGNVPTSGYVASEMGGVEVPLDKFSVRDIEQAIAEDRNAPLGIGTYIGTWTDKGTVYIDRSVNFTGLAEALVFAHKNGQKAIYSLNTKKTIYL